MTSDFGDSQLASSCSTALGLLECRLEMLTKAMGVEGEDEATTKTTWEVYKTSQNGEAEPWGDKLQYQECLVEVQKKLTEFTIPNAEKVKEEKQRMAADAAKWQAFLARVREQKGRLASVVQNKEVAKEAEVAKAVAQAASGEKKKNTKRLGMLPKR